VGKKKLTTPSKRGQKLIRRPAVSRCVSPWSGSLRGEVTCLLAFIFTLDREHDTCQFTPVMFCVCERMSTHGT
jgi:hypothetical protein